MSARSIPILVGHRGWPAYWPENTLEGFQAAAVAGARWLECDVQLSAERMPFVCHDVSLARTAGLDLNITRTSAQELETMRVGEPARFQQRFANVKLARLEQLVDWLTGQNGVNQFVEIKRQSLHHHGTQPTVDVVMQALRPALDRCVVISFDHACLDLARQQGAYAIGWAVERVDDDVHRIADTLHPNYLFTDENLFLRMRDALPGAWQWVVYHTEDVARVLELAAAGAHMVETNDIGTLLRDPLLNPA